MLRPKELLALLRMARWPNVLMAGVAYSLSAYISGIYSWQFASLPLFWLQGGIMLAIMGSGYWVNDVFDRRIDRVNKPGRVIVNRLISAKKTLTAYIAVSALLATASAWLLPVKFSLLNLGCMAALYAYAAWFKQRAVIGNVVVSLLTAMVVLAGAMLIHIKMAHLWAMAFAFQANYIREITKDIEDIRGDLAFRLRTLPILTGIRATKRLLLYLYILFWVSLYLPLPAYWVKEHHLQWPYLLASLVLVQLPLAMQLRPLLRAVRPSDFGRLSRLQKWLMAGGLVSLALIR